jgi:hypothetical protein
MKRKDGKVHEEEREAAGIYTSGHNGGRRQSGEAGCADGALPEAARPNPNGRTPMLKQFAPNPSGAGAPKVEARLPSDWFFYFIFLFTSDMCMQSRAMALVIYI